MLVDTHCHLADPAFDGDRDVALERAAAAGVAHVVVVGESVEGSERAVALASQRPGLSATAGVHPHEAKSWSPDARRRVAQRVREAAVVAVGETGLDYHYDHSPRADQRRAFEAHLALAAEVGKPLVVHAREADDDMAAMLAAWGRTAPPIVLHSFSSGPKVFEVAMRIGAYLGFSGMITFRNWRAEQTDRLTACPPDRLLVETDAPFLAPVPHRGRRNEPAFVREVALKLAELCGAEPAALITQLATNTERCFGARVRTRIPYPVSRIPV